MQNMNVTIKGTKLLIEIDLTQEVGTTDRGNAKIATTEFWEKIPGAEGHSVNLMVMRKKSAPAITVPTLDPEPTPAPAPASSRKPRSSRKAGKDEQLTLM
jgi:hypothetical protein